MSIADKLKTVAQKMEDVYRTGLFKYAPKSTASGETIVVNNSAPEPFVDMIAYGHSWQNTTEGKNLYSGEDVTVSAYAEYMIEPIPIGTYTISAKVESSYSAEYYGILLLNSSDAGFYTATLKDLGNGRYGWTLDSTQECVELGFYVANSDASLSGHTTTFSDIKIELGTEPTPYEPYTHGASPNPYFPQPIESANEVKVLGGNYFNINNFVNQDDGVTIQDNGFAITNTQGEGHPNYIYTVTLGQLCPELKAGDEVYLNFEVVNSGGIEEFYLHSSCRDWINGTSLVITQADLDGNFNVYGSYGTTTIYKNIVVSKEPIPFEPYKEPQTLSLPSLYGIGDGRDYVDFERKKLVRRCVELTFDGNEDWIIYDSDEYYGFYLTCLPEKMDRREGLCNQLIVDYAVGEGSKDAFWLGVGGSKEIYVIRNSFFDSSLDDKGLSNWKAHLNENPLKVVTYLAEPIETDLTDDQIYAFKRMRANSPNTTIIGQGQVDVTYIVDNRQ